MEKRKSSRDAKDAPVQLLLKTKEPFDLTLADSKYLVHDWGVDSEESFFLPLTWDRSRSHIISIFRAFKEATCDGKNPTAIIEFPKSMMKKTRSFVREMAVRCGLGANSRGVSEERFLTVYTSDYEAKQAEKTMVAPTLNAQQKEKAMDMWRCWQAIGPEGKKFSQKEIQEMMRTGQVDPQLRTAYQQWKGTDKPDRNPAVNPAVPRQQGTQLSQELFDNIEWLKPESGQHGQVFYNKMYLSDLGLLPENGEDSYWTPEVPGSTQVLSIEEAIPTLGLVQALVCTDVRLSENDSYVLNYFPPSVALSVVCPADSSMYSKHKELIECAQHPSKAEKADNTSKDTGCECPDKRVVKIIHPTATHRLHANFCVLRYAEHVRLVVTSASFSQRAWSKVGQLGWYCDLPLMSDPPEGAAQQSGSWMADHPLCADLAYTLYHLDVPQETAQSLLTGADFSSVSEGVRLIPCVPGRARARDNDFFHVGLGKLALLLSQVPWPTGQDPPIQYQTPHVDLSATYRLYRLYCSLTGQRKGLLTNKDSTPPQKWKQQLLETLNHLQVVHPWVASTEDTTDLPPSCWETHMSWDGDIMCSNLYDARQGNYKNVTWNAKTIMRTCHLSADKGGGEYGWLLLGSHSMTPNSWGEIYVQSGGRSGRMGRSGADFQYQVHSWELSVLILPQQTNKQGVSKLLAPDMSSWDIPARPEHLCRCPPGGLPLSTLDKVYGGKGKELWHLVGQVTEVKSNGSCALIYNVPYETSTPSKLPLDEWLGKEHGSVGYEALLHVNVALLCGLNHLPPKGMMVDMLARVTKNIKTRQRYLCVMGILHTWEHKKQPGHNCNEPDCVQHGPKHPEFANLERHSHDFVVVGLDLDLNEPLYETYPDPKPPPGRDKLIGRLQRACSGPFTPRSGPGSKQDYSLEIEAVWQKYFIGL